MKRSLLLVSSLLSGAHGFHANKPRRAITTPSTTTSTSTTSPTTTTPQLASTLYTPDENDNMTPTEQEINPSPTTVARSQALPWMDCPAVLRDCDWAGNAGFDPLHLAATEAQLWHHREAEVKHARLAMLAAAGLPLSDLFDKEVDAFFGIPFLESTEWHNILERISPVWWGACLGLTAAVDMYGAAVASRPDYVPGQLHFDPFNVYPEDAVGQKRMCTLEIQHGRVAMLAMAVYLLQEYDFMTPGTSLMDSFLHALEEW